LNAPGLLLPHRPPKRYRRLAPSAARELRRTLEDWQVRGVVVAWPVQPEGWCGASCGRVLFALDGLRSHGAFCSAADLPMCLWDQAHTSNHGGPYEDEWGRSEQYTTTSEGTVHCASKEQYGLPPGAFFTAAGAWRDFSRAHWPEYHRHDRLIGAARSPGLLRPAGSRPSLVAAPPSGRKPLVAPSKPRLPPSRPNLLAEKPPPPNLRNDG
jgi:hypothetical protein